MKKIFSILVAGLILLSGMNLSFARHICGGEVVAVNWSFTGEKAGCDMENEMNGCPLHNEISSNCCQNEIAFFAVDNNYSPSSFQIEELIKKISPFALSAYLIPSVVLLPSFVNTNVSPPDKTIANAVCLADICVFRI